MLSPFTVFVVALAGFATAVPQKNGKAIPIKKHSQLANADKSVNFHELDEHATSIKAKILRGLDVLEKNTRVTSESATGQVVKRGYGDTLTDYKNVLWYGNISVGTPPASLSVVFDTGSSDLFLSATLCDATCSGHTLYNPDSSSSAQDVGYQFELTFGGGAVVWGETYTDTVSIGGFTATSQTLGAATSYSSMLQIAQFPADGLMGMAFQSISVYDASPFFQTLISQGQAPDSVFSFKLSSSAAELFVGGSNSDLYTGDFSYAPVTQVGFWQVTMDNLEGNGRWLVTDVAAIIDTGSTFIVGPPSDVSSLYSAIGGTPAPYGQGYYTFPCDSFPSINLTFGGTSFPISPSALNLGTVASGSSDCVSGLVGQDVGHPFWVIGDVFLQGVYTAFDVGSCRVGFAQLS